MSATSTVHQWATRRQLYVDNLKVILIAAIIAGHAAVGYAASTDAWSYSDVREVTLTPVTEGIVLALLLLSGFVIPLLFLIAGLYTPGSLQRKGVGAYVRDRLLRLGVPFVLFAVLLWPLLEYGLFRWLGTAPQFLAYWQAEGTLDTGVLWFVGVLLIFSLAYAGWVRWAQPPTARTAPAQVRAVHLVLLTIAVTVATFLVRLVVPLEADNRFVDLNVWEWPACAALFGLGIVSSRQGWGRAVPEKLRRQSRAVTIAAVAALVAFVGTTQTLGVHQEQLAGGLAWPAFVFAGFESTVAVFAPAWVLGAAQRHLDRKLRWIGPVAGRSAYGAFMLQGPVLIALALAVRPLGLPAEVKALLVAVGAVAGSFWLAWLLVSRFSVARRVL